MAAAIKKWVFFVTLFNESLSTSHLIELLAMSLLTNKEKVRMFSSKNDDIGFENHLKMKIIFTFWTQKFPTFFNFGQNFVWN